MTNARKKCAGKRRYFTEQHARQARAQLWRERAWQTAYYPCPNGHHWHLGRPPGWGSVAARKARGEL